MATITDFDVWLAQADPDTIEEIYSLYCAVTDKESSGVFNCSENNDRLFLKANHTEDTLMLASEKAVDSFLATMRKKFNIDMDIEAWYGFHRAMEKDD